PRSPGLRGQVHADRQQRDLAPGLVRRSSSRRPPDTGVARRTECGNDRPRMRLSFVRNRENRKHRKTTTCVLVWASIWAAACDRPASRTGARPPALDPPSGPGATSPNLTSRGDHALLTWIEPGGQDGNKRVRFSELADSGWTAPSTIAEGRAIIANWVD